MTIEDVISRFNTTPFIFAGSGITRRYYDLPDWSGLLACFAKKITTDEYAFRAYESKVQYLEDANSRLPAIASLIEHDFNQAWFENKLSVRSGSKLVAKAVSGGVSPFKAEISAFISSKSKVAEQYTAEVEKLRKISKRNLAGIITTNYDRFFENTFEGYKTFVGQDELVFSQLHGIAEIYKIHGSVDCPESIVINREDYLRFKDKGKYLAAKLMTIFMEYPIIFIGYSISDPDIQDILKNIVECLPKEKIDLLQSRFVFVEYKDNKESEEIAPHSIVINGSVIEMTRITLSDFGVLYEALSIKKAAFPVKLLRRFKEDLYSFALTSKQKPTMQVAPLEDGRIDENMLALTIGLASTGLYGLARAVNAENWYKHVILHDLQYSADDMLEYAYPELARQNSGKLPVWYYIRNAKKRSLLAEEKAPKKYEDIVTEDSTKRNRTAIAGRNTMELWNQEKSNLNKAIRLIGFLPYCSMNKEELSEILEEIFQSNRNILTALEGPDRSNLKKLIRIYDFLEYGQRKTP